MKKILIKDLFKYLPAQIVPALMAFLSIPIVTRLFKPDEYGQYVLVLTTANFLSFFIRWSSNPVLRFFPEYSINKKKEVFFSTVLKMTFLSMIILGTVFLFGIYVLRDRISWRLYSLLWFGIPVFYFSAISLVLMEFLRARREIGWFSIFKVWGSAASILIGIVFVIVFGFGIEGLFWGFIVSWIIALPFLWRRSIGNIKIGQTPVSFSLVSRLAKYGFPLVIGNIAAWVLSMSDRYIIEISRNSSEVGIYSAVYNISEKSILLIATLFSLTSGSMMFNLWEKEDPEKSGELLSAVTRFYLIVAVPFVVCLIALAIPIIKILTGSEYTEGYTIIPFVAGSAFLFGLGQRFQPGLLFYHKTTIIMVSTVFAGMLNVLLNIVFVPVYGYYAAAVTTLVCFFILFLITYFLSRRYFRWGFPTATLIRVLIASCCMGMVMYFMNGFIELSVILKLIVCLFTGLVLYATLLVVSKEIKEKELRYIRSLIRLKKNKTQS